MRNSIESVHHRNQNLQIQNLVNPAGDADGDHYYDYYDYYDDCGGGGDEDAASAAGQAGDARHP